MQLKKEFGRDLTSEVAVVPDEIKLNKQKEYAVYVGTAENLYWDESNHDLILKGGATLSKYIARKSTKKRPRLSKILPPKVWLENVPVLTYCPVWSIRTESDHYFFISSGKSQKEYISTDYRGSLKYAALEKELKLSEELIETVFGPIDDELMRQYEKAKEFNYFELKDRK